MISDKSLFRVSLAVAAAGLLALVAITLVIEPKEMKIRDITGSAAGQSVSVKGVVDSYLTKDGNVFITLNDSAAIKIVVFSREAAKQPWVYDLKKGDIISAAGKVQVYRNELEIVAEKIVTGEFS